MFFCPNCQRTFSSSRGLSVHYYTCNNDNNFSTLPSSSSSSSTSQGNSTKHLSTYKTPINNILQNMSSTKKRKTSNTNNSIQDNFNNKQSSNNRLTTASIKTHDNNITFDNINYEHTTIHQNSNFELIEQQNDHQSTQQHFMKTNQLLAQIDLLNIMSQHNCHNAVFNNVMRWAIHWNNNKTYFDKNDVYQFQSRNVLMNHLSKLYDMQRMKPTQKTITISDVSNDTVSVTVFDFKQQLLSLLRDKELMNPSNLLLPNVPGETPNINNDIISDINDSDWYNCAYNHYNDILGINHNRVICGIILAIDKTHTDAKGKLCLEGVNFTLSIFNMATRRNNYRAWRSLGFINDLNTIYGGNFNINQKDQYVSIY